MYPDTSTLRGRHIEEFLELCQLVYIEQITFGCLLYPELAADIQIPEDMRNKTAGKLAFTYREFLPVYLFFQL